MRWSIDLSTLWRSERGGVALTIALSLVALVGIVGLAVDLGVLYNAKAELQNTADAAALAAAQDLIAWDAAGNAIAQPDAAVATAQQLSWENQVLGTNLVLRPEDVVMGYWDAELGDFDPDRIGPSSDPADLTAVRVTERRDDLANSPVTTFFAGVLGLKQVGLTASSTALLGYAGSVEAGVVDLPIAVSVDAVSGEEGALCGTVLEFHSENDENCCWTSFFTWPCNDPVVRSYVEDSRKAPAMKVGDELNVINGNLSNHTFQALKDRFLAEGGGGPWQVILPVVEMDHCQVRARVVGFCTFVITDVRTAPDKNITGYLKCGMVIPNSRTGGIDAGSRATFATLVQ